MVTIVDKSKCSGCHACANVCPKKCINMVRDTEGFEYPVVDALSCVHCNLCNEICPIVDSQPASTSATAYAAVNKNEGIRLASSSGGVFTLLAEQILSKGGVVFGAAFSKDFHSVHHIAVESCEELSKIRGSKYLQSRIGDTYREARDFLEQGRVVLFSGTPCQIAGLKAYLGKEYDGLFTQDIICHGVPSPMVWDKYLTAREMGTGSLAQAVSFRNKANGWKKFSVEIKFTDGTIYRETLADDLFMKGFLSNLFLRPSCYNCAFKGIERVADITLADFWGIQHVMPQIDDDKGTSLIVTHSPKGERLLYGLHDCAYLTQIVLESAIRYNTAAISSPICPSKRDRFLSEIQQQAPCPVLKKHTSIKWWIRGIRKARRIPGKIIRYVKRFISAAIIS